MAYPLGHPLRVAILAHLRLDGAATVSEIARALNTNSGATSYHTRILAAAGLVADTGLGNNKTRIWAATTPTSRPETHSSEPLETANTVSPTEESLIEHDYVNYLSNRAHKWVDESAQRQDLWAEIGGWSDQEILVTAEHALAFQAELSSLLERYRRRGAGSPGANRLAIHIGTFPLQ